jgi:plastocyanin
MGPWSHTTKVEWERGPARDHCVGMPPRLPLLALGLAAVVAGCGTSADGSTTASSSGSKAAYGASSKATATATPAAAAQTLQLTTPPGGQLKFDKTKLTAKAGTIKIEYANPTDSGMPHGIAIQGGDSSPVVQPGAKTSVTVTLEKGTYTFICPVPGHAQAGMKGTLTVQ